MMVKCSYEDCRGGLIDTSDTSSHIKDGRHHFHDEVCQSRQQEKEIWRENQEENFFAQLDGLQRAYWQQD